MVAPRRIRCRCRVACSACVVSHAAIAGEGAEELGRSGVAVSVGAAGDAVAAATYLVSGGSLHCRCIRYAAAGVSVPLSAGPGPGQRPRRGVERVKRRYAVVAQELSVVVGRGGGRGVAGSQC